MRAADIAERIRRQEGRRPPARRSLAAELRLWTAALTTAERLADAGRISNPDALYELFKSWASEMVGHNAAHHIEGGYDVLVARAARLLNP